MNDHNEFDSIIAGGYAANSQPEYPTPGPYGAPVKTGLTPRGKAAIAVGGVIIASTALFSWQHYSAQQAAAEAKAAEIQLQRDRFELEKLKTMSQVNAANTKLQTSAETARQKRIDSCVNSNKGLVGKQLGATYRSVLEDCQAQYPASSNSSDMANAASATDATNPSGGGVSPGLLLGGAVLAGGLTVAWRKSTKSNQT